MKKLHRLKGILIEEMDPAISQMYIDYFENIKRAKRNDILYFLANVPVIIYICYDMIESLLKN